MSKRKAFTAELNHAERAQQGAYRREVADGGDDGHDQWKVWHKLRRTGTSAEHATQ